MCGRQDPGGPCLRIPEIGKKKTEKKVYIPVPK
jgi:hypothetical protein